MPITYAEGPAAIEEERRLLYVGMTRAKVTLAVSWALARNPGGRASRKPSRFLDRSHTGATEAAETVRRRTRNRKVANCRECGSPLTSPAERKTGRCADCPASYDEELFERLRTWRRERAAEDEVPAYVVFTDATLQLIAEHQPDTEEALLRISGIGRAKVDRYADEVLQIVR